MPKSCRLPLIAPLVAVILAAASPAASAGPDDLEQLRGHALERVNRARAQEGLPALTPGAQANAAAQAHAEDMLSHGYYAHTSPAGETVRDRYMKAGGSKWRLTAENIARCRGCTPPPITASVDSLHEEWMRSPLHRANILRRGVSEFGFGIAVSDGHGLYAVEVFAGVGLPADLEPAEQAVALTAEAQLGVAVDHINRLRKEAGAPPLEPSLVLSGVARNLLPAPSEEGFNLHERRLYAALPESERGHWRSLNVLGAACGGCGEAPAEADIRDFAKQWLQDERLRAILLARSATHLGFAITANGDGRKTAASVIGQRR